MRATRCAIPAALCAAGAIILILTGCAGETLLAYTGGGLPPGEPDLGGIVVASVDGQTATAQPMPPEGTEPLVGARVQLLRGRRPAGTAMTGAGGYFRFERPATGSYTLVVTPPADRPDLLGAERAVYHTRGAQTFVTVELPPAR
jgi:hypothetical protein